MTPADAWHVVQSNLDTVQSIAASVRNRSAVGAYVELEDLCSEVVLGVWQRLQCAECADSSSESDDCQTQTSLATIRAMAYYATLDVLRIHKTRYARMRRERDIDELPESRHPTTNLENSFTIIEHGGPNLRLGNMRAVDAALCKLHARTAHIMRKYLAGDTVRDIATATQWSVGTVQREIQVGLQALRDELT